MSSIDSVYSVANESMRSKVSSQTKTDYSKSYFDQLRKKLYPTRYGKTQRPIRAVRKIIGNSMKRNIAHKVFGSGAFGVVVIKPEMVPFSNSVRKFLNQVGCKIVTSKVLVMSKNQVEDIYAKEMSQWQNFPVSFLLYTNAPSKVLVFKHASREKYLELMARSDPKRFAEMKDKLAKASMQEVFHWAIKGQMDEKKEGTLRGETTYKILKSQGVLDMKSTGKQLDPTGYLTHQVKTGKSIGNILTGVHSPDSFGDLINHAISFLTVSDLKKLESQMVK